jgi:hypothetical protein
MVRPPAEASVHLSALRLVEAWRLAATPIRELLSSCRLAVSHLQAAAGSTPAELVHREFDREWVGRLKIREQARRLKGSCREAVGNLVCLTLFYGVEIE